MKKLIAIAAIVGTFALQANAQQIQSPTKTQPEIQAADKQQQKQPTKTDKATRSEQVTTNLASKPQKTPAERAQGKLKTLEMKVGTLTDKQKKELTTIFVEENEKLQDARKNPDVKTRASMQMQLRKQTEEKINSILTTDQREKYKQSNARKTATPPTRAPQNKALDQSKYKDKTVKKDSKQDIKPADKK